MTGMTLVAWRIGCFCWESDPLPTQHSHTTCQIAASAGKWCGQSGPASSQTTSRSSGCPSQVSLFCFVGSPEWPVFPVVEEEVVGVKSRVNDRIIGNFFCEPKQDLTLQAHTPSYPHIVISITNILYMCDCDSQCLGWWSQSQTQRAEELTLQRLFYENSNVRGGWLLFDLKVFSSFLGGGMF